jgi:aminopeptidase N
VSTSPDQIAITPGYLRDEWVEAGRRYFHYKMDAPIVNFYTFVSGRYEVARDMWNDIAIEIFYHPTHSFNVSRMIEAVKKALAYYTAEFGPYQFRQVRIIEFPAYRRFAQSFPNTIPYSESAHFINDLRDEENIDMVFFITAHETAHQWWGHQVIGGDVQGAQFLLESITQYSAFMIMEKDFGRDQMQKFLAYELERYLMGRGNERVAEQPLVVVEQQPYIYYSKGGLALYALRDYIGEARLNGALRQFLNDKRFQDPPYTNSIEFLAYLYEATPGEYQYLIEDLFETITLYDNRADDAEMEPLENGQYRVTVTVESHKYRADGLGVETEVDHNDWVEIGVFGKHDATSRYASPMLYREKHRVATGKSQIEVIVDDEPVKAGIDPRNLLIDRVPSDNVVKVS